MAFDPSIASDCPCVRCRPGGPSSTRFELDDDDPHALGNASSPSSTSQNGWPADADPAAIDIITISVPLLGGRSKKVQVTRKAAPALTEMIQWWDRTIEPVTTLGGYNYRNIRGSSTVTSNHGSGTAIDINAEKHPLGKEGTVPAAFRKLISDKASSLGLRWGGDYRTRKDEMHVELRGGFVAEAAAAAKEAATVATSGGTVSKLLMLALALGAAWQVKRHFA